MNIDSFTSLPPSIIDDLYEEPTKLDVYSFEDFLKLPLNDLYLEKNGEYKPEVKPLPETVPQPEPQSEPKQEVNIPSER